MGSEPVFCERIINVIASVVAVLWRRGEAICAYRKDCFVACGLLAMTVFFTVPAFAADKNWNASGDAADWTDDQNWSSWGVPTAADDVSLNYQDASVNVTQTFNAKTLTLGSNRNSTMTVEDFITGTVAPAASSDVAVLNAQQGKLILKGPAGKVTLKGQYKESDQTLADQPSLIFYAQ
jgi:hypothetical protein